jgi:hypothetical protein
MKYTVIQDNSVCLWNILIAYHSRIPQPTAIPQDVTCDKLYHTLVLSRQYAPEG